MGSKGEQHFRMIRYSITIVSACNREDNFFEITLLFVCKYNVILVLSVSNLSIVTGYKKERGSIPDNDRNWL
jgi:hypothetical protein